MRKVEDVNVQIIVRDYDDEGRLIDEVLSPSMRVFRAKTPDIWTFIDAELMKAEAAKQSNG